MSRASRYGVVLAVVGALLAIASAVVAQQPAKQRGAADVDVQVSCSKTKPGEVVATIRWVSPPAESNPNARVASDDEVDVTTAVDGFSTGAFVTVWPPRLRDKSPARENSRGGHELDPLRQLRVSPPLSGSGANARVGPSKSGIQTIQSEGLVPGVNYFWRIRHRTATGWDQGQIVRVPARWCPSDAKERSKEPRKER